MKNILRNLSGGFFRTLGRFLLYICLGVLGAIFLKNYKITDLLGFSIVNAAELKPWAESGARVYTDEHGTLTPTAWQTNPYTFTTTYPVTNMQFRLRATDGLSVENSYTFEFGYLPTPDAISVNRVYFKKTGDVENEDITCGTWRRNNNGYYLLKCSFVPREAYTSNEYLYINIVFNQAYLTSIRSYVYGYDERLGTNAVITDTGNQIINNNNQNTEDIINNINNASNTINNGLNALTDSQKVCNLIDKNNVVKSGYFLNRNGIEVAFTPYGITDYIIINDSEVSIVNIFNYSTGNNTSVCYYGVNKNLISCEVIENISSLTIPNNTYYIRSSIYLNENKPTYKICKNGNQGLVDALTDDSSPDVSSLNDMAGWLPAGPLDSILNLPLTLLNSLTTALSGTCSPITLTLPYISEDLTLPCISSIYQQIGAITFVNWVGTIASAFILFKYLMALYKWVDDTLTFRENNWLDNWGGVD